MAGESNGTVSSETVGGEKACGRTSPPLPEGRQMPEGGQIVLAPAPRPNGQVVRQVTQERHFEHGVARLEAEMEAARRAGFLGLLRLRWEAWLEERMKGPAIQKMQARQAVLAEQCKTAEAEIRLRATVQSGEVGAQRHRIEWNEVNRQRLAGELQSLGMIALPGTAVPVPASPSAPPPVSAHVTDDQVEAVALRGLLLGVETEEDWLVYRAELSRHLSPYAVEEVGQRLRELWRLHGQAGAWSPPGG